MEVEQSGVGCRPAPVLGQYGVGHQHVRMELRIARARRPVAEGGADQAAGADAHLPAGSAPGLRGVALEVAEGVDDRFVVGGPDGIGHRSLGQPPQQAHRLRGRKGEVEAGHPGPPDRLASRAARRPGRTRPAAPAAGRHPPGRSARGAPSPHRPRFPGPPRRRRSTPPGRRRPSAGSSPRPPRRAFRWRAPTSRAAVGARAARGWPPSEPRAGGPAGSKAARRGRRARRRGSGDPEERARLG